MTDDARILVVPAAALATAPPGGGHGATAFVVAAGASVAEGGAVERMAPSVPGHGAACVCCTPRAALVEALHRLFIRRARGEVPFFRRVVAAASEAEIAAALADPLVAARFRAEAIAAVPEARRGGFRCE
jgi:hypothetical protein